MANEKKSNKLVGKKARPVPTEKPEIGVDLEGQHMLKLLDAAENGNLDTPALESFNSTAQSREYIYNFIDSMALDDRVSAVLDVYASDCVETNDDGKVVWCESSDPDLAKTVNYILDSVNVDKHAYEWIYSLIKYGDLYLKMYRRSDVEADDAGSDGRLNEDVNAMVHSAGDHYVHYVEMVPNPGEMFDLTKMGKTVLFVQAPTSIQNMIKDVSPTYRMLTYKIKRSDVNVYGPTDFVHASLADANTMRSPEEVSIFLNEDDYKNDSNSKDYTVKKGQSFLYNLFKVWRQLSLIEDSLIVNRATRSSLVRIMQVEVGNMPAEQVAPYLQRLKANIEQKTAMSLNNGIQEYNNPGPMENTIFVPTHGGQGVISSQDMGGEYDPKQLTDLDYFVNKFYGDVGIPKQFFSFTDDGAGFNGGSSLAIISSRYGKNVKKYQNTFCQLMTDMVNLFLIDKGQGGSIGKFTIKMQPPLTQEEIDRRENMRNRMGVVNDVMSQVGQVVEDDVVKLKVMKTLLSQTLTDNEVVSILDEYIEAKEAEANKASEGDDGEPSEGKGEAPKTEINIERERPSMATPPTPPSAPAEEPSEPTFGNEPEEDSYLPSPDELGVSMLGEI